MAFEKANKDYFDKMAADYELKPWQQKMTQQILTEVRDRIDWLGLGPAVDESTRSGKRMLDYACGTGAMSRGLGPSVTEIRGIDLSENMVEQFNKRASEAGLPASQIHAVQGNVLDDSPSGAISTPDFFGFDLAIIGLGFHHFALDTQLTMCKKLGERLKPGGALVILDFFHSEHSHEDKLSDWPEEAQKAVSTAGFTTQSMKTIYEEAGYKDFAIEVFEKPLHMEFGGKPSSKTCFMAKGTKP